MRINEKSYNQNFGTPSARKLRPGDIIKLEYLTEVPVDCLILQTGLSSQSINYCYVSSSNIDGKENLIKKRVPGFGISKDIYRFMEEHSGDNLFCSDPDTNIYDWKGVLCLDKRKIPVNMSKICFF